GVHVAEPGEDRQLLFAADAQRLVELAAPLQDACNAASGDGQTVLVVRGRRNPAQPRECLLRTIELAERHPPVAQLKQEQCKFGRIKSSRRRGVLQASLALALHLASSCALADRA